MKPDLENIASQFNLSGTILKIEPFGNGHINDTYRITTAQPEKQDYILQRKNHIVFKDVPGMVENIARVTAHIRKKLEAANLPDVNRKVISLIKTANGKNYYQDEKDNFWVVFVLIPDSHSVENIKNPEHAYLAGKGFGRFQKQLEDLEGGPLIETIIDFHNIEYRYQNFKNALAKNYNNRKSVCKEQIDFAFEKENEMHTLIRAQKDGDIPVRITHNDTKINNILFDETGQILCVIDLDTVMPGLVHFDFGDAIRTAANTAEEDEKNLNKITVNLTIFEAFAKGFLEETKSFLTKKEIELLPHSAKFMTFIMGIRFLTDYLDGDIYYKTEHPEHNLERCKAQFKLVSEIDINEAEMIKIIEQLASPA